MSKITAVIVSSKMQNAAPVTNGAFGYSVKGKYVVSLSGDYSYWVVLDQCLTSRQKLAIDVVIALLISCVKNGTS